MEGRKECMAADVIYDTCDCTFHFVGRQPHESDTRTLTRKRSLACEGQHVGVPFTSMEAGS